MDKLKELMSRCKCGVHVTVNAHRDVYESAEIFLSDMSSQGGHEDLEIDPAVKAKMIETNTIVEVQFYPNTPVSFYVIRHHDLDAALDEALSCFSLMPEGVTKLTKAERLVNEQMLALLEWAADHPKRWHDIGPEESSKRAAELLEKRGVIEIRGYSNHYRLAPKGKA